MYDNIILKKLQVLVMSADADCFLCIFRILSKTLQMLSNITYPGILAIIKFSILDSTCFHYNIFR